MTLRELMIKIGVDVDEKGFEKTESGIDAVMEKVKHLAEIFAVFETGKKALEFADEADREHMAFTAFLGDAEEAKRLLGEIGELSDKGVFPEDNFKDAASSLVSIGTASDQVVPKLKEIGNVAAIVGKGNPQILNQITEMYSMIQSRNEVSGRQLKGMTAMQIPIVQELAKQMGVSEQQIYKMKISAADFNKAFKNMSETRFADGMKQAAGTWSGILQIAKNLLKSILEDTGKNLIPMAREFGGYVMQWLSDNKETMIVVLSKAFEMLGDVIALVMAILRDLIGTFLGTEDQGKSLADFMTSLEEKFFSFLHVVYKLRGFIFALIGIMLVYKGLMAVLAIQTMYLSAKTALLTMASNAYRACLLIASIATKAFTAAQWLLNIAMDANPVGLIIIGVAALIALSIIAIKKWNEWGAALTLILGPIGMIINAIMTLRDHWANIKEGFTTGGIIGGLKAIGAALLDMILHPMNQILTLAAKIPGLGKYAGAASKSLAGFREKYLGSKHEEVPAYAKGTDYVPRTGLALIHQGEQIIPAGRSGRGGSVIQNQISMPVNIQIPMGTTDAQSAFLKRVAGQIFDDKLQSVLTQAQRSNMAAAL